MPLRPLFGHRALRARLAQSANSGRLPASLLLQGKRGVGKQRLGLWLAQLLLCERALKAGQPEPCGECIQCRYAVTGQHPDLHWFFPRPKMDGDSSPDEVKADFAEAIGERMEADALWAPTSGTESIFVATVRALVQQASLRPAMASRAVFLVGDAERMIAQEGSDQAANAFLKLLEEPPATTTIIMTSSEPGALLPTIRSRVVTVRVAPLPNADVEDFLDDSAVQRRVAGVARSELLARAAGAPGELLVAESNAKVYAGAARLLEAALKPAGQDGVAERTKAVARLGVAGARGVFSDTLDALTVLLHERTKQLVAAQRPVEARRMAAAIPHVETAKLRAQGNVSPQLLGAALVDAIHRTIRP